MLAMFYKGHARVYKPVHFVLNLPISWFGSEHNQHVIQTNILLSLTM